MVKINFFRSKEMSKQEILFPRDTAFDCLLELGMMGKAHFIYNDDAPISGAFSNEVILCSSLLQILNTMDGFLTQFGLEPKFYPNIDKEVILNSGDLNKMEEDITQTEVEMKSAMFYDVQLHRKKEELEEKSIVIANVNEFLKGMDTEGAMLIWNEELAREIKARGQDYENKALSFFICTIATEQFFSFERLLFRLTRGSYLLKHNHIVLSKFVPFEEDRVERKTVFLVCFFGVQLGEHIYKALISYHAEIFECPDSSRGRSNLKHACDREAADLSYILKMGEEYRNNVIEKIQNNLFIWRRNLKKSMQIFIELNKFEIHKLGGRQYLRVLCWIPKEDVKAVKQAMANAVKSGLTPQSSLGGVAPIFTPKRRRNQDVPPTLFELNQFTRGFQNLIDAYGMANYEEINPAPYTIITFPFLFAVMFGDVGHGFIMACFALGLILTYKGYSEKQRAKKNPNEIGDIIYGGRYIIFLMGLFSVYTGLIYNDCFSKSLNIFGSHWRVNINASEALQVKSGLPLNPASRLDYTGTPYWFGLDPIWKAAGEESIVTFNSIKMKLAIILGVSHMIFGLILSAFNNIHFKHITDLFLLTLPQLVIFCSLFLYLVILIFFKWTHYGGYNEAPYSTACAPSILITFINMILMKEPAETFPGCNEYMFVGQDIIQKYLVCQMLVCVPILLCGKPIYFHRLKRRIGKVKHRSDSKHFVEKSMLKAKRHLVYQLELTPLLSQSRISVKQEEYDMLEVWIHSAIHAIDAVLGAVSHTASYLRLWALSLAHEQLSSVLWNMVLRMSFTIDLGYYSSVLIFVIFFIWAALTIAILVTMEALSAFLHTLRLHWVEFQSKFYVGAGTAFMPFKFDKASMQS